MAVRSHVVEEHHGRGRGHTDHGNGKGLGHQKHQEAAMADGVYELEIGGVNHSNPGPSTTSAPTVLADGSTMNTEVQRGSITIADAPGSDDDGALRLVTNDNSGRLRFNVAFDQDQYVELGDLDNLSFDYYIDSASRTDVIPVIRLIIDADGDLATTGDRGELVFEYAYQGLPPTTQDAWQTADLVGGDWTAWQRSFGVNRDQIVNMTEFSDWADADGYTPAGGLHFDENSLVLGYSFALGSGNGTADIYMDNLQVGGVTYDFIL